MNPENQLKLLEDRIKILEQDLAALNQEYYNNNFSTYQDFSKFSNFTTRLKVPSYSTNPTTCEVGEICENAGKLYICSSADTWVVVGTQS